jgi:hypothetical protein
VTGSETGRPEEEVEERRCTEKRHVWAEDPEDGNGDWCLCLREYRGDLDADLSAAGPLPPPASPELEPDYCGIVYHTNACRRSGQCTTSDL